MEDTLIDVLITISDVMGISGEGMAGVIGVSLFILIFMSIVACGKIFFSVLSKFGHDYSRNNYGNQEFGFEDNLSLSPNKSIRATNINTRSMFDD